MPKHKHDRNKHEPPVHLAEQVEEEHEQIQALAYRYWEQRGSPQGDPDTDWFRAEHEFGRQREAAKRL